MNSINSDVLSVIVDFLPKQEIDDNMDNLCTLNTQWKIVMHWKIQKQKIYKYFDLGREYNKKFSPFSQATFGEIATIKDKLSLIKQLFDWLYKITKKKFILNKDSKLFLNKPIINIGQKELIDEGWKNFFLDVRKYISNIPVGYIVDNPNAELGKLYKRTETDFIKNPKYLNELKENMKLAWVPIFDEMTEELIPESYNFVPEIWYSMEQILSLVEKRPLRDIPYDQYDYVTADDFKNAELIEGIFTNEIIIFRNSPFDDEEQDSDTE